MLITLYLSSERDRIKSFWNFFLAQGVLETVGERTELYLVFLKDFAFTF